jgi:hypothetical protein
MDIGDKEIIEILSLVEKLKSPMFAIRDSAKKELTGPKRDLAFNVLLKIISEDRDEYRRAGAIESLLLLPDVSKIVPIIEALKKDTSVMVREKALGALGILKDPDSIDSVLESLNSPDRRIVLKAIWALGEFKDERALEPFKNLIETTEDLELKRQLKLAFARAFPDIDVKVEKTTEEKKKELSNNVNKVINFVTNWKIIVIAVFLLSLPFLIKLLLGTTSFSFTKPQLTKELYREKITSIVNKKNQYVHDFKDNLERIYVKEGSVVNQAQPMELWGYSDKFAGLKREMDNFTPPEEYKDINKKIINDITVYSEAATYSGNIYTKIKVEQSLSYNELIKDIDTKIKRADNNISLLLKELNKAK